VNSIVSLLAILGGAALLLSASAMAQNQEKQVDPAAAVEEILDQKTATILSSQVIWKEKGTYVGWPSIVKTKEGELIVAFSGDREQHVCPWGKTQLVRSTDLGKTWTTPVTINNTPLDDRDAGIIQTKEGTLLVTWFTSLAFKVNKRYKRHLEKVTPEIIDEWLGYWVRRSSDNGATWGDPIRVEATTPHGPIELKDGRLLYVGINYGDKTNTVIESRDDGKTWTQLATIAIPEGEDQGDYHEPHVVENTDGSLVAMSRYHSNNSADGDSHLRQSESIDSGKTWTTYHKTPIWGYPPHLVRLKNGWLLAVYGVRRPPFGERACISRDGGKTWDIENEITLSLAPSSDLGYPASVQLDDGSIYTIYYEVREKGQRPYIMGTHWKLKEN
jgi:sialidase-1